MTLTTLVTSLSHPIPHPSYLWYPQVPEPRHPQPCPRLHHLPQLAPALHNNLPKVYVLEQFTQHRPRHSHHAHCGGLVHATAALTVCLGLG